MTSGSKGMMTIRRLTIRRLPIRRMSIQRLSVGLAAAMLGCATAGTVFAQTVDLADKPLFSTTNVPGNLMLALSVEWPTANTPAYPSTTPYASTSVYLGYFDPAKCYRYIYDTATPSNSYFTPHAITTSRTCASSSTRGLWSGNFLNWSTMQSLDIFRWVLTGGDRVVDTASTTTLEKTRHSGQGGSGVFPDKELPALATVTSATPFAWTRVTTRVQGLGTAVYFSDSAPDTVPETIVDYTGAHNPSNRVRGKAAFYRVYVRVRACDAAVGLETNCKAYGANHKPEGLMQQYATQLRYGAMGYLNDDNLHRDGGVLRARMKAIGPQTPVPGGTPTTNTNTEWDATTGVFLANPDPADASATTAATTAAGYTVTVNQSGVINYLNRFGKLGDVQYKSYDPVSELYYSATRYLKNQGNVPAYSSLAGAGSAATMTRWVDGFPVVGTWSDPMQYSCQRNFILGIGDVNAWSDKNLPGSTIQGATAAWYVGATEPSMPAEVSADTSVDVTTATNMVGQLEGIASLGVASDPDRANAQFIAGLAYNNHTKDIRSDLVGNQTIDTYWLDVLEGQTYLSKNPYWLAAKYGGFKVPTGFNPDAASNGTGTLTRSMWSTSGETVGTDPRPDNYFVASNPAAILRSLQDAFASIATANEVAVSTAFSTTTAKISRTGTGSYATKYDPSAWTGDVEGSQMTFNAQGVPSLTYRWSASQALATKAPDDRKIVTCCTSTGAGLAFRETDMGGSLGARTHYDSFENVPGATTQNKAEYLLYLRGDRSKERASGGPYRTRAGVMGDVVNSKANPVGRPAFPYSDQFNAGYSAFKAAHLNRKTIVYVGSNGGMVHALDGDIASGCTTCGEELFAFIPSFVYGTTTTAATHGLASLGNPSFTHRPLVDGSPIHGDVDMARTDGSGTTTPDWKTVLVGGLGKGGRGYYALDITDPASWTSESAVAGKFLWEFTDARMGYTLGDPVIVRTTKYGWVVALASGVNNSNGVGYLFLVNPRTGALLEAIATPQGTAAAPINMSQISAYVPSLRDFMADAIYGTDLRGNVWRFDLTAASGAYPAPTKIAALADGGGAAQPITVRPVIEVDPSSGKRYVVVGTGRLLADSDITLSQTQSVYAIVDGTSGRGGFYTAATLPASTTFPITRDNLNVNATPLTGIGSAPARVMGWYTDLGVTNSIAERINVDMTADQGVVTFGANLPNGQACNPEGTGRVMSLRLSDGRSVLVQTVNGVDTLVGSVPSSGIVTTLAILNVAGQNRAYYGTSSTQSSTSIAGPSTKCSDAWGNLVNCVDRSPNISWRRLNWREVQPAN